MPSNLIPTPKRQVLVLVMTEQCNLRCSYCYESKTPNKLMPSETAQNAIIEAFDNPDFDELEINFFGGEPLLAFDAISVICEWVWSNPWPKPYVFFASTNGTLVHGPVKEWFSKHKDQFVLSLSLDGTPDMHNSNRTNSYGKIDFNIFKELWPFQTVKMTVSRETVSRLAEGVIHIHNLGFKLSCNHAFGIDWQPDHYSIYARELRKLADFYIDNPHIEPCSLMLMALEVLPREKVPQKFCGTGTSMSCIDRHGKKYPCQAFMPMSTGKAIDVEGMFDKLGEPANYHDPRCRNCSIEAICPTCYGTNLNRHGDAFTRDADDCMFAKIRAKATAYMLSQMLIGRDRGYKCLESKSTAEVYLLLEGIKIVNTSLVMRPFSSSQVDTVTRERAVSHQHA